MTISSPVTNNNNNDRAYLESYPCPPLMPVYDARHEKFLDGLSNAFYETYKTYVKYSVAKEFINRNVNDSRKFSNEEINFYLHDLEERNYIYFEDGLTELIIHVV
ncbi:unnamed protein product [Oikopleura dioica]|uniref:MCM3-like winged helix domain-containing protein n=1 Tax=Oikopleura dioica TaxID=34765 RepID=E4Z633_OIKDI|nr:unnamed protein product [Oikopleura dioica]